MLPRLASSALLQLGSQYPVTVITGPRQAGKSTLAKTLFPNKPYISLENLDEREFAQSDPRGFLKRYLEGAVFDEVQRCPELLSYIQTVVDEKNQPGQFILTGSAQLTLLTAVSQSLAGRAALLSLLPFSWMELKSAGLIGNQFEQLLFQGCYPPIYDRHLSPNDWYSDYIQTYIERDIRQILNIQNLGTFQKFLKLCAGRVGQLLNLSSLASDCGISHSTATQWLNLLEATYIVFRVQPYFKNFSKRLVKTPKLYFYDSGLICSLLRIESSSQLETYSSRGSIFESWVASEILKKFLNHHRRPTLYFWRDHKGMEVDFLIEHGDRLLPLEVKSGSTVASDWFDSLKFWQELAKPYSEKPWVIYGGEDRQSRSSAEIVPWNQLDEFLEKI